MFCFKAVIKNRRFLQSAVIFLNFLFISSAWAETQSVYQYIASLRGSSLPGYANSKLDEIANSLETVGKKFITTSNEEDSLHEIIRIHNTTRSTYEALNHYVYGWNTTIEYIYRANIEAVKRGVSVSRTFIISDNILDDSKKLNHLLRIMEIQNKDGIKVFYGLQRDLKKEPDYNKYVFLDVGLSDGSVFAKVTAVSIKGPQPYSVNITWNKNEIQKQSPFPFLKKSRYIHPFDERAEKKLLEISAKSRDCRQ